MYNIYGKELDKNYIPELQDPSFGYITEDGKVIINWDEESDLVDANGFDKSNVEENGIYKMDVVLPVGMILIRYGTPMGRMTAPFGTPYEMLGLPYKKETIEYHQYRVIADGTNVKLVVSKGRAYKMFNSPGNGVQFLHMQSIYNEIIDKKLEEDYSWMKLKK